MYEIDPLTGQVTTITESLWAADGLWIDQARHLLYVGQVANSKMLVWNISSQGGPAVSRGSIETGDTFTVCVLAMRLACFLSRSVRLVPTPQLLRAQFVVSSDSFRICFQVVEYSFWSEL